MIWGRVQNDSSAGREGEVAHQRRDLCLKCFRLSTLLLASRPSESPDIPKDHCALSMPLHPGNESDVCEELIGNESGPGVS